MDIWKFFAVGHANHRFCNPLAVEKFDELIERLALPTHARALDIACGKAELLVRMARRYGCTGVGVDLSPPFVADSRRHVEGAGLSADIEIVEGNGADYAGAEGSFDVATCIGASWIYGGHSGSLEALSSFVKPGGVVMVGEPYFIGEPPAEYLAAVGMSRDSFGSHAENVQTGIDQGLGFLYAMVSTPGDWDRYEGLQCDAGERYARDNPDDPDAPEILEAIRKRRHEYLTWGRDALGWAVYMFLKDPARA
jgi:SAM-dependent methyltransferase